MGKRTKLILKNNLAVLRAGNDKMSQQSLADATGVSRNTINAIENGKYLPSLDLAFAIAEFFGVTIEQIFYKEENK